ncbi:MAG TPA: hypothetical protein PKV93_13070 [Fervidobacterium sp.]|nr:hypothetical protein [Fervidobacterium sp.]
MKPQTIKVLPEEEYGHVLVMSSDLMKSKINVDERFDTNIIEKFEQEQIDDKFIMRWTAILNMSKVNITEGILRAKDIYKRAQSGLIYTPYAFGNTGLLVLFTDYGAFDIISTPPTTLTTAYLWYKNIQCKQDYIVVCTYSPVSQKLFGLQDIIVPSVIMTDDYELPPLSVSKINNGIETIRDAIVRNRCLER